MSDKMRWRYGAEMAAVEPAVDSETVIEIGDMVCLHKGECLPAGHAALANADADLAREDFAAKFLGVAMQRSRSGETAPIRVATTGVFEFDCPSGTFELGDLIGVDENAAGDALLNQQVAKVAESKYAIGRVAKRQPSATTSVLIDIRSTVMTGGVEGGSPSGV